MLEEIVISHRAVKHPLLVVWNEAFDALEVVALLVVLPQSLHWLNLDKFRHCFEGELVGKSLVDDLELPIFGIKFEVLKVFIRCLDEDHEVDLVLVEILLFDVESLEVELLEIFPERFVNFVVFALSFIIFLVHFLDPLSELPHDCGLDLTCLQFGLLERVDQLLGPLLGGLLLGNWLRLCWLGRKIICCCIHLVHEWVRICLCFLDLELRLTLEELLMVRCNKTQ